MAGKKAQSKITPNENLEIMVTVTTSKRRALASLSNIRCNYLNGLGMVFILGRRVPCRNPIFIKVL